MARSVHGAIELALTYIVRINLSRAVSRLALIGLLWFAATALLSACVEESPPTPTSQPSDTFSPALTPTATTAPSPTVIPYAAARRNLSIVTWLEENKPERIQD